MSLNGVSHLMHAVDVVAVESVFHVGKPDLPKHDPHLHLEIRSELIEEKLQATLIAVGP